MEKKKILVFGVGILQRSIIKRAKGMGLFVVGIDPDNEAFCKGDVDAFEVVGGQDFEGTCAVVEKYGIDAIVTAATDKPLVMMARIAEMYGFPFYSVETAEWSTDKYKMKQRFLEGGVPCAQGRLISNAIEANDLYYPLIVKPRDNSGSRGVKLCRNALELQAAIDEALLYSHLKTVLVEEYIGGQEYSIEGLHYDGKSEVLQFTEKTTTEFPYNVELAHKQPANLTDAQRDAIREVIAKIVECMHFENCPSHTELKINERGVFVIETSPRLGGDYITSTLVPLSTGINIEDQLLKIAVGENVDTRTGGKNMASGVKFLDFGEGVVTHISSEIEKVKSWENVIAFDCDVKSGDHLHAFKSGLDRYGQLICQADTRDEIDRLLSSYEKKIESMITISTE